MLEIKDLTVSYSEQPVFTDLTVNFAPGKITGIIGPNGAGKSTLIKSMLGLIKKESGQVTYNAAPLNKIQKKIAYVEQRKDLDQTFPINVFDLVNTGNYARLGLWRSAKEPELQRVQAALEKVALSSLAKRQIGNLSGGQLQRVFVARAIVQDAELIILDEPFVGIDMQSEQAIMKIMRQWRDEQKTIIVVHHDLNKVMTYFDDLVILNHGIVAAGPTEEVYTPANMTKTFSADLSNVLFATKEVGQ